MALNLKNRSIYCKDNLDVLRGINSSCIDLIYLDPPFNKNKTFTALIGSSARGASFDDIFRKEDVKDEWVESIKESNLELHNFLSSINEFNKKNYNYCYLVYMAIRLLETRRVLKDEGSIYLHCDPTMSHYLKILMDIIFGENNFRNEIVWCYHGATSPNMRQLAKKHDIIFWYSKSSEWIFNVDDIRLEYSQKTIERSKSKIHHGKWNKGEIKLNKIGKFPEDWLINIKAMQYITPRERTGYPTQKPLKLLEQIIKASSNEGDVVLDPFCGCATTCIAAEKLDRQWVGIDVSPKAFELVKLRLIKEVQGIVNNQKTTYTDEKEPNMEVEAPKRTDKKENDEIVKKYVYVISHPNHQGFYKVGITNDCDRRLNSYQTSCPNRAYKLEFSLLTPKYRDIEKHIHKNFKSIYEWVSADLGDIIKEIENF